MPRHRVFYLGAALLIMVACTTAASHNDLAETTTNPGNGDGEDSGMTMLNPSQQGSQSNVGQHPAPEGGTKTDGGRTGTTADEGGAGEAGADGYCTGPLAPGDIRVVELMIKSVDDDLDDGEWVEIQSARDCTLRLGGVVIESPYGPDGGTSKDTVTLPQDFELAANAIFVAADTDDTTENHDITPVFSFDTVDLLDDTGDTITIRSGNTVLDAFSYPAFTDLPTAESVSFPADCAWSQRSDFSNWSYSFNEYYPGFDGTPNTDNTDVECP